MAQKWHHFLYALTSSNINRFSKLFHCENQQKICHNNTITKDPTPPQLCRYTITRYMKRESQFSMVSKIAHHRRHLCVPLVFEARVIVYYSLLRCITETAKTGRVTVTHYVTSLRTNSTWGSAVRGIAPRNVKDGVLINSNVIDSKLCIIIYYGLNTTLMPILDAKKYGDWGE